VKGKLFNSGLNYVEVVTRAQRAVVTIIAATFPTTGNAWLLVFLIDATVVHNSVAAASATAAPQLQANTLCSAKTSKFYIQETKF
jgi:hypothetical protein